MISDKTILRFFLVAVSLYFLLTMAIAPLLHLEYGISNMTRNIASTFFGSKDVQWVDNYASRGNGADINVKVITEAKNPQTGQMQRFQGVGKLTSRTKVMVPMLVLLSLIAATFITLPMSWRNRIIVLILASVAFFIYMLFLFKMTVGYVEKVTQGVDITTIPFGQIFNTNIGFMTIIPTILWALVTAWAVDWKKVLAPKF